MFLKESEIVLFMFIILLLVFSRKAIILFVVVFGTTSVWVRKFVVYKNATNH